MASAASSTMVNKRPLQGDSTHAFACDSCYKRKQRCNRANPCSYCNKNDIECTPSSIATTNRPRKRRFPEADLLARIKKYESALLSYGADLEAIRQGPSTSRVAESPAFTHTFAPPVSTHREEKDHIVLSILDGEGHNRSIEPAGQQWYDRIFAHTADASSFLFAVDPIEIPGHPAPFDMFKLWQIYCDNVHPLNKILHAPSFQRKMSNYGAQLHLAPPSDQALFFAVYVAALYSISAQECEAIFYTNREVLLDQYKLATQVWLRRAGLWRTSELSVLQAFILFLSSMQNIVDPRSISCFVGVAERIARRLGLHRDISYRKSNPLEQEVRRRVWWELLFLDTRANERIGLSSNISIDSWSVQLPSHHSDADLESVQEMMSTLQPSSEVLFLLIRAEAAQFSADLRKHCAITLTEKLQKVDEFERRLQSRLLCFCDSALPHHRLTILFAQLALSRIRMSIYTVEESICRDESRRQAAGLDLLQQCIKNLKAYIAMREDPSLNCYKWFLLQNLPILGYVHLLRLLQVHASGTVVDQAWQVIEAFRNTGIRLLVDSLTMKAWDARIAASTSNESI